MARLWSSGFELNSATAGMEWTAVNGSPTIQSSTVRSGTYAFEVASLVSSTSKHLEYTFLSAASTNPYYFRFYFQYTTLPSATNTIARVLNGTTVVASIRLKADGALSVTTTSSNTLVADSSTLLASGTWYRVELYANSTGGAGASTLELKINGNTEVVATNLTVGAINIFRVGGNIGNLAQTQGQWFFDDVAINDGTGSFQNTWPGSGKIIHLKPNGTGTGSTGWSRAGADSGANWSQLDEVTPNDTTDYVQAETLNVISMFTVQNASLGASDTVNLVAVGIRSAGSGAGNVLSLCAPLIVKQASGTQLIGTDIQSNPTWTTNRNGGATTPNNYLLTAYQDPNNANWTNTTIDSMEIGIKKTGANGGNDSYVSTIWALVEYVPSVGGSTGQIKVYNGATWVAKPVKVWSGSAWVVKPVKYYNGSTWTTTPY